MDLDYVRFLLALLFVIGLIGLLALLARRFGFGAVRLSPPFRGKNRGEPRRLAVVEVTNVDARRRLVLVRRDDTEHLVLLGVNGDLLVEGNIPAAESRHGNFAQAMHKAGDSRE